MKILIVEDDEQIISLICPVLLQQNYTVEIATDGQMGLDLLATIPCSLIMLDVVLPKLNGIQFCQKLRAQRDETPVLMMTARDTITDKVLGLDAGADDYLVKPVDLNELVARIRALLRRGNTTSPILEWGSLRFDPSSRELSYAGQPLNLRPKELAIMELLLRQKHRLSSRQLILDHLWSLEDCPDDNTIKAHIRGIRRSLETVGASNLIETLYGKGYRLNPAYLESSSLSSVAPATPSAQVDSEVIAKAWQQVQHLTWQRLQALNESVQTLKRQPYNQAACQQAEILAHQLVGTLGSYGFEAGSRVAKQLEQYLQQHHQNSSSSGFDYLDCSAPLDINTRSLDTAQLDLWMLALYQVICPALTPVLKHSIASTSVQPSTKTNAARQLVITPATK